MTSLCDRCYAPGQCCKALNLWTPDGEVTYWVKDGIAAAVDRMASSGLPFEPVREWGRWTDLASGDEYASFVYRCTKLTPEGRCGIYDDRPALCRSFEPLSDRLCVHFGGAEAGADEVDV